MKNFLLTLLIIISPLFSTFSQTHQCADICGKWESKASYSTEGSQFVTLAPNIEITEEAFNFVNNEVFNSWAVEGNIITLKNDHKTLELKIQSIAPDRLILIFPKEYIGTEMMVIYDLLCENEDFVETNDIEEFFPSENLE